MVASAPHYRELAPAGRPFQKAAVGFVLWFLGRAVAAAATFDPAVQADFDQLPDWFAFTLEVIPNGPAMVIEKQDRGRVRYTSRNPADGLPVLRFQFKHLAGAFQVLTFRESSAVANASSRFVVDGDPAYGCVVIRILDRVQVLLLPAPIARLAVKRYPKIPVFETWKARLKLYIGMLWTQGRGQ